MTHICLLLSGAALLINGLASLGTLPRRDAAVFSLVVGSVQLILSVCYLGATAGTATAGNGTQLLLGASGMFLFGLTYVYVGVDFLLGLGSKGLGWFCGLVGACGILLAAAWSGEDPFLAVLWLCWSHLWILFFLQMALGTGHLTGLIGWSLVLTSQATATVPAFMGITGHWPKDPQAAQGAAASIVALLLLAAGLAWRGRCRSAAPAAAVVVVVESPLRDELRL